MKAVVFENWATFPVLKDVERPVPGPGEVLLKVAGAGACHSDISIYSRKEDGALRKQRPPFVLGHETSGWIEEVGPGVAGYATGDAYLVYGPLGCGRCARCAQGQFNYCAHPTAAPHVAIGIGRDGGMAEFVTVPAVNLVPLGDAAPIEAAALADAGLTAYHAIKVALPHLNAGGRYALVIGLGGLGQMAVQILRALSGTTVIATDTKEQAMAMAARAGAKTVLSGMDQSEAIRKITGGRGVDAVFDFVGATSTIGLAMASVAPGGRVIVVGIQGGDYEWIFSTTPYEATITNTYWGTITDLHELVALYRAGQVKPDVERFAMEDALSAYRLLQAGEITGRAIVVPHDR